MVIVTQEEPPKQFRPVTIQLTTKLEVEKLLEDLRLLNNFGVAEHFSGTGKVILAKLQDILKE